ncbi:MAG: YqgQ family protein [Bacilli bacterium]
MQTLYDVQQLLKEYGTIIYTGNRAHDLALMREEVQELSRSQLVSTTDYNMAMLLINSELTSLENR